jgi:hypothetical protein
MLGGDAGFRVEAREHLLRGGPLQPFRSELESEGRSAGVETLLRKDGRLRINHVVRNAASRVSL